MTLGPILGDERCPHALLVYYHSGYSGNYAVCQTCGGHLWGESEEGIEIPPGVKVVDLDTYDDEEDEDSPNFPMPTPERLQQWRDSVAGWKL